MRASKTISGWEAVEVESLGGSPYYAVDGVVWYVPTGSPEGDRARVERAIRAHQSVQGAPLKR